MKKSTLWSGGIIFVLAFANMGMHMLPGGEAGATDSKARSRQDEWAPGSVTIPQWLVDEVRLASMTSNGELRRNIFTQYKPEAAVQSLGLLKPQVTEEPIEKEAAAPRPARQKHQVDVLAINLDGNRSSALIRLKGDTHVVFVGEVVLNHYIVKKITAETVYIDVIP